MPVTARLTLTAIGYDKMVHKLTWYYLQSSQNKKKILQLTLYEDSLIGDNNQVE